MLFMTVFFKILAEMVGQTHISDANDQLDVDDLFLVSK